MYAHRAILFSTLILLPASCSSGGPGTEKDETIAREVFVRAYVDLRVAALTGPTLEITPEEREQILADAGITEEDLLEFVEVWGSDVQIMKETWEEVDSLMQEERDLVEGTG